MVDFLKYKLIYFLISVLVIGAGLFSISRWVYDFSIDFVGGTNINYQLTKDIDGKVYAMDDNSALKIVEGNVEVISEGEYLVFN